MSSTLNSEKSREGTVSTLFLFQSCNRGDLDNINLYWNELGCEGEVTLDTVVNARVENGLVDIAPGILFASVSVFSFRVRRRRSVLSQGSVCFLAEELLGDGVGTPATRDDADDDKTGPPVGNTDRDSLELSAEEVDSAAWISKVYSLGMIGAITALAM